jgi:hypothetical protein
MYGYFVLKWEDSKINHREIGCKSINWVCSFTLEQAMKAQIYSSVLSLTSALDGGGWLTPHPSRSARGKETQYPLCRGLGGIQGQCGRVQKISHSTTIQSLHRPAYSKLLYQLHCPGPRNCLALVLTECNVQVL